MTGTKLELLSFSIQLRNNIVIFVIVGSQLHLKNFYEIPLMKKTVTFGFNGFFIMEKYKLEFEEWLKMLEIVKNTGINIFDKWKYDFMAFYKYMGEKPKGSILTREYGQYGFEPGNCIWSFPLGSELIKERRRIGLNKLRTDSITGVTGVTWNDQKLRWWARIRVDGKQKHLLFSKSQEEAIKARLNGEIDHFGHIQQKEYAYLLD